MITTLLGWTKSGINIHHVRVGRLFQATAADSATCRRQLSAVVLQVGSNDFTDTRCSVEVFVRTLMNYVQRIQQRHTVHRVVIMQILHRKSPLRYRMNITVEDYNMKVDWANAEVKNVCVGLPNVLYWEHSKQLRRPDVISTDGVHVKAKYVSKYWRSVRGAALLAVRAWSLYLYSSILCK